jgi:hypothetical protein
VLADELSGTNGCLVFAEGLLVGERAEITVYLLRPDGTALYVGELNDALPGIKAPEGQPLDLQGEAGVQLKIYFGGGISSSAAFRSRESAIVICGSNTKAVRPPIFVDGSTLEVLDLTAARKGFAVKLRERQEIEKAEAARIKEEQAEAGLTYKAAWNLIAPGLQGTGRRADLVFYVLPTGDMTFDSSVLNMGGQEIRISFERLDKKGWRWIYFKCDNNAVMGWIEGLAVYIRDEKPGLPGGFKGYLVSRKKG